MAQLQARGVWAGFGERPALAGIDLDLGPGDAVGLIGRSGVGKSTLIEVLAGALEPSRGSVTFDGRRVAKPSRRDRKTLRARLRLGDPGENLVHDPVPQRVEQVGLAPHVRVERRRLHAERRRERAQRDRVRASSVGELERRGDDVLPAEWHPASLTRIPNVVRLTSLQR